MNQDILLPSGDFQVTGAVISNAGEISAVAVTKNGRWFNSALAATQQSQAAPPGA